MSAVLVALFQLVWPGAPAWLPRLGGEALPAIVALVRELDELQDRPGPQRAELVVKEVGQLLDEALDDVAEWHELEEARRDRILLGLVELALFVDRASSRQGGAAHVRKALRRLRRRGA